MDKPEVTIEREALLDDGWRMTGLPPRQLTQQIFKKGDKTIIWDTETKMIVEGSIDE